MFAIISLVKARYKNSWNSKGEENTSLLEELYNYTAMAWIQNVDIFAICHRYTEDSKSWFNGYCLYFHRYLESNYFSLPPCYPLVQTTIILAPNRFSASTLAPCAICSSQSKFFKKWSDLVPSVFKTFYWLLISLRIKYKFPTEATRLYVIWPFLWPHITLFLSHPIPATLPSLLFLKYNKGAPSSGLCICCFLFLWGGD